MNKNIINSKIVLFLGAGASAFLDKPLMVEFVDDLIKHLDKVAPDLSSLARTIIEAKGKDLEVLLNELDSISQRSYFKGEEKRNYFKDRFDAPENPYIGLGIVPYSGSAKELPNRSKFGKEYERLCKLCDQLKWHIYDKIFEKYYSIEELKVISLYDPLINTIKKSLNPAKRIIPVFTTNYDKAIEKYCETQQSLHLVDGFQYDIKKKFERWEITNFEKFKPKKNHLNLCLFKLHGSIFWYRVDSKIIYSPISTQNPSDARIEPVLLFPSKDKDYALNFDPFITAYSYLQRCFDNSKLIIFIGYSFRDHISITFLKSALRFNDKLKVMVIDPNATKLKEQHFSFYSKRFICIDKPFTNNKDDYLEELEKSLSELKNT